MLERMSNMTALNVRVNDASAMANRPQILRVKFIESISIVCHRVKLFLSG